jgi:transposase, IS5 family
MKQISLFVSGFRGKPGKITKREKFLGEMDQVIPWSRLVEVIKPHYPEAGNGRPPTGLEKMLRIYFLQQWYNLSDPAIEEALYDSETMRRFVGIENGQDTIPDESTVCLFRHLLEEHRLPDRIFAEVKALLTERGLMMSEGTIVDATIINAPSSTKNQKKERDPEMHQTKKGNQWYFGMKAHTGVDKDSGLVHTVAISAANLHDSQAMDELLHGQETALWGDSAYQSNARQHTAQESGIAWHVNVKASRHRALTDEERKQNRERSRARAIVEHPYRIVKVLWGHAKVRYKGLLKNALQFFTLFALANVYHARRKLLSVMG